MRNVLLQKKKKLLIPLLLISCILSMISMSCNFQSEEKANATDQLAESEHPMEWFKEAKFGLFIHWGPYSMLEGEWNGKQVEVGKNAEWAMKFLKIPVKEYRELAKDMNPVKFDAREWVRLAKETGMKYLVITAKHHDGFAMYKSDVTPYNIVDWTPFKRDPLKELAEACAEEGIVFGVYYSHREDWNHPGGYGNNWEYNNDWGYNLIQSRKI
jgi:alpha-L-fucosidase